MNDSSPPISELPKQYDPREVEPAWCEAWKHASAFHADETHDKVPFAMTLPPPNVTGSLHMGHALGGTLQDILIRWHRMRGHNAMWMPGTDHAGIATQMLVERDLKKREGKSRHDLGREEFVKRVWVWKEKYGGRINEQMKTMGFSLDWPRERFTMDPGASAAVREVFVRLYEEELIYRANRLVNWCTDCYTALSDLEVNNIDEKGSLWEIAYPVVGSDERLVVATTRPETMLGDTGIAVHPDDERYKSLIGKKVRLPLCDREIPIVADSFVDPEFGSGAVKVTPGHDFNDFECAQRCGLPTLSIIDQKGFITAPAPAKYVGMTVQNARISVVEDLEAGGFLAGVKDHTVPRGRCDRSGTVVEPLLSEQWWLKMQPLAEPAIAAVEAGKTKFVPELWTKTYMHWMNGIKDWTISRQLWWGHRIPAWFCQKCSQVTVSRTDVTACKSCGSSEVRQDDDVLDTWFSSALWPFSTLGWPEKNLALQKFYPNDVLVTAPDIIFFWVARMMMMGLHFMGDVPFRTVYLTPIVTDENGDKMSKTKGNVIDPLDVTRGATLDSLLQGAEGQDAAQKYIKKNFGKGIPAAGADALRFTLASMASPGRGIRLSMERIEGYRHFINKLWNASRFSMMHLSDFAMPEKLDSTALFKQELSVPERWILSRLARTSADVGAALSEFRCNEAAFLLYHFVWDDFCDWFIELQKPSFAETGSSRRRTAQNVLAYVLDQTLRLLHPFIPFVTEEIWHKLTKPKAGASLAVASYPESAGQVDVAAERDMEFVKATVASLRMLRSTYNVPPSGRVSVLVKTGTPERERDVSNFRWAIELLARCNVTLNPAEVPGLSAQGLVGTDVQLFVPLAGLIDVDAEVARIKKEMAKTADDIQHVEKKLGNPKFMANAPTEEVDKQRSRLSDEKSKLQQWTMALAVLGRQ